MATKEGSLASAAIRPPHPASLPRGSAVQPRMASPARPPHPATVDADRVVQPANASWKTLAKKKAFADWEEVKTIWFQGGYTFSQADKEWLDIAKALKLRLPPKIGHHSGKQGDNQQHVSNALKRYIENVVSPAAKRKHGSRLKREQLYKEVDPRRFFS